MSFPEIGLTYDRKIEMSEKIDEFSTKPSESQPWKLTFWKSIWMNFPGLAYEG